MSDNPKILLGVLEGLLTLLLVTVFSGGGIGEMGRSVRPSARRR